MSTAPLRLDAWVGRALGDGGRPPAFAPGERVPFALRITNDGPDLAYVPDPFRGGRSLTLSLRRPSGGLIVLPLGDLPPPPGTRPMPVNRSIVPGGEVVFDVDLAALFPLEEPGLHGLVVEYVLIGGVTWLSPEIDFTRDRPAGVFLDLSPNEGAAAGYHGIVWVERTPGGDRALLFDDSGHAPTVAGAAELAAALPSGSEPALSSAPAGFPFSERWVAWIGGDQVHARFHAHGDPGLTLVAPPFPLPNGARAPRLVRPLLAEAAPYEGRPRCAAGVLAENALGETELHLLEIDRDGIGTTVGTVPLTGVVAGFAIAPTAHDRLFIAVLETRGWVQIVAVSSPWDGGPLAALSRWYAAALDGFLLGDARARLDGSVRVGLLARRGAEWLRIVIASPPAVGEEPKAPTVEPFKPPAGAEPVRVRLDDAGRLHLLYRLGDRLTYVPPGAGAATWSRDGLGQRAREAAHLLLRRGSRAALVAYDVDHGPLLERL